VYHGERGMAKKTDSAIFSIVFKNGKANQNRLPLSHVIATLQELDFMVREVGRKIQRDNGVESPDGDFGIELLAGSTGIAFRKGSVKAQAAITRDVRNGIRTLSSVIGTTSQVEKKSVSSVSEYGEPVYRRLSRISPMQEQDGTELGLQLVRKGHATETAKFSERGIEVLKELEASEFAVEAVTLYGKLRKLTDMSRVEGQDDIWGELIEDNGERWRVKFHPSDYDKARKNFTKQVIVLGDARYFKTKFPRVDVKEIREEEKRDYVAAFDRFSEEYRGIFGNRDTKKILSEIRGR
jgi:hypothetical protein